MGNQQRRVEHPMCRRFACTANALAISVLEALDGDVPRKLLDALRNQRYHEVISEELDFSAYSEVAAFRDAYMAVELMSKFPDWDLGIDRKRVAVEKFVASELTCSEANSRLRRGYVDGSSIRDVTPESVIWTARGKIARLLGSFNWDHAENHFAFGPGATHGLKSKYGDAYFKFRAKPESTRESAVLAYTCISRVPAWFSHAVSLTTRSMDEFMKLSLPERVRELITIVPGNRITTVPKNAKTDRIIAIEPTMNGYMQHGIGAMIRSRLKRVGVDLDNQTRNQELALLGSIDGSLATIDLAAASDSVSTELVRRLLPPDWALAIEQTRCPEGVLPDGTVVKYQKVSSMGNGFTFELESLIFWAISSSVQTYNHSIDRRLAVYGDDIVIPTSEVALLVATLEYCGFKTNSKKSFWSGDFRESCGKHYFRGCDVTPLYIREGVNSPERAIWFANQIRRYSRFESWGLDARFRKVYEQAVSCLPQKLRRPSIPDGYGDAALIGDFDEVRPQRCSRGHEGYIGIVNVRVSTSRQFDDAPFYLRQIVRVGEPQPSLVEVLRSREKGYKKKELVIIEDNGVPTPSSKVRWRSVKISAPQWVSHGPWLG